MNQTLKERQLVPYADGAKAMMVFKPHRTTAVIEFYVPSKRYREYMEVYKYRIEALEKRIQRQQRVPISNMGYHVYNVNKLFQVLINNGYFNPKLDDVVFDIDFDTPPPSRIAIEHALLKKVLLWQDASLG